MTEKRVISPFIEDCLPISVRRAIGILSEHGEISLLTVNEIRLRAEAPASVTCDGKNIVLSVKCTAGELSECVTRLCGGSVYAHGDTIRMGYVQPGEGVRVGICGTLASDGRAVREIRSVNIRIPHIMRGVSDQLMAACFDPPAIKSMLIYSPPGIGKTTALRDIAFRLGGAFSKRVVIVDTRGELFIPEMFVDTLCDVLTGYSRAEGIEIATRTMSPEVIICDELGDVSESTKILGCAGAGVPLIASAHASNLKELLLRPNIKKLHDNGIFAGYARLSREKTNGKLSGCFSCDYTSAESVLGDTQCFA